MTLEGNSAEIFNLLELAGTIAFAISGAMLAARQRLDWLGAVVLAVITAVGGGTVRDLLLGTTPVSWMVEPWPIFVAMATAAVVIMFTPRMRRMLASSVGRGVDFADAGGLAVFTVTGADIALAAGVTPVIAIMIGAITATGGGVMRDVLAGRVPLILTGEIYAVAALVGATSFVILLELGFDAAVVWWLPILLTFGLRVVAMQRDWSLPTLRLKESTEQDQSDE